jgi:hypothetical protein
MWIFCILLLMLSNESLHTMGLKDPRLKYPQELRVHTAQKTQSLLIPKSKPPISNYGSLKFAVILSGHIRSFAFCEKSWQRYLLRSGISKHLFFFAHAMATNRCQISHIGIEMLKRLCTNYSISYSTTPIVSADKIRSKISSFYSNSPEYLLRFQGENSHGNYFDMHRRRHEAYLLAIKYAVKNVVQWDAIMYMRLDIAFYSPALDIYGWYLALKGFERKEGRGILAPPSCNFHGVCDRFAMGLPREMEIYFDSSLPYAVLNWSLIPVEEAMAEVLNISDDIHSKRSDVLSFVKVHQQSPRGNSEHLLECWFIMNNITQVWVETAPVAFTTVRSVHASSYCSMDRNTYIEKFQPQEPMLLEVDRCTAGADVSPLKEFDFVANSKLRCGTVISRLNSSELCLNTVCACGRWG